MSKGLIQVYYGDGKGKTTAAFGLALRCAGRGRSVVIAQFLKSAQTGEVDAVSGLAGVTLLRNMPVSKFTFQMNEQERALTATACAALLESAVAASQTARLLVLDEIIDACTAGVLSAEAVCSLLDGRPEGLEIVITGHSLPDWLEKRADYITNMKKEKHPYDLGVAAREDIEY